MKDKTDQYPQVRLFYNKETQMIYKIVNNLRITMYYRSKKSFGVCASTAREILDAYYQGRFVLVNEKDLERFIWKKY